MPDDVVPGGYGNVLVIDLQPDIHALIRLNLATVSVKPWQGRGILNRRASS